MEKDLFILAADKSKWCAQGCAWRFICPLESAPLNLNPNPSWTRWRNAQNTPGYYWRFSVVSNRHACSYWTLRVVGRTWRARCDFGGAIEWPTVLSLERAGKAIVIEH